MQTVSSTQDPIQTVTAFLAECGKGKAQMQAAFRAYLTAGTVWENVGLCRNTGVIEALAFVDSAESSTGVATFVVDMLAIAALHNTVLTERVDIMLDVHGNELTRIRLMGIFEVAAGKITAWRDYFDTTGFLRQAESWKAG